MKDIIQKEKVFNHSIDKVWEAISNGTEISKWFIAADFKPEVGYQYTFTASEENGCTVVKGKVLEASPYTLKYSWIAGDDPTETTVAWYLEEVNGSTKLILKHSGISKYAGQTATEMMGHFEKGWEGCISGLTQYIENEIIQPAH
jgi:uncharacterized protein YndB with AHSA1/START domain